MIYSLSEIDANCKKAARGAGFSWGYAEEAGKAARWLAAHQLPGAVLLAEYLTLQQKTPEGHNVSTARCPLLMGAMLCDSGHGEMETSVVFEHVAYPLLLLPYLTQLSKAADVGFRIQWPGTFIRCRNGAIYIKEEASIAIAEPTNVSCDWLEVNATIRMDESFVREAGAVGQFVEASHWEALEVLAHLTYVPATEASRRGAGPT